MRRLGLVVTAAAIVTLSACGSGSGSGTASPSGHGAIRVDRELRGQGRRGEVGPDQR